MHIKLKEVNFKIHKKFKEQNKYYKLPILSNKNFLIMLSKTASVSSANSF